MPLRPSLILAVGAILLAGIGCGDDDSSDKRSSPGVTELSGADANSDPARYAAIAYFLSRDPAACTEDATKHHIKADYGGHLTQCEAVRSNNTLTRDDFSVADRAKITGNEATLKGRVLLTGERFVVELKKVDGSWKIDRLRGSQ
jgi:hypothetical protein